MTDLEKAHEAKDLDLTAAGRGVWLVKVPKYLAEKWESIPQTANVGKLAIGKPKFPGGKPDVTFTMNDAQMGGSVSEIPKQHKFMLTGVAGQALSILTETPDVLSVEGKVIQRAECRPVVDANYMRLKKAHVEMATKPNREIVQLDKIVQSYKPVAAHSYHWDDRIKKKDETKRPRAEKDKVIDMLFAAFEKHQFYNFKDLVEVTKQPVTYLKEILKEYCNYNTKAPHKNMWELKAEFRHYNDEDKK